MRKGTQLSFWEEGTIDPSNEGSIVFDGMYCLEDCPFNETYQARGTDCTIYVQIFASDIMWEPSKWLITIKKDTFRIRDEEICHYIVDDMWEAYAKIKELTGREPLWRLFRGTEDIHPTFNKEC